MDIARQQPSFAFIVLLALAVATPFALADAATPAPAIHDIHQGIPSLGDMILWFQWQYPLLGRIAAGVLVLLTGLCVGLMTIRQKLYPIKSSLAISLYGMAVCGFISGGIGGNDYLVGLTASLLLAMAIKNYSQSFNNEYCFERVFRASFWLGLLPLVYTPALLLVSGLLLAAILFKRTLREVTVAIIGLVLPALVVCYINWGAGGGFAEPIASLVGSFEAHAPFEFLLGLPLTRIILLGALILMDILAVLLFISNRYAVGTQPRYIVIFNICMLALTVVSLVSPAASYGVFAMIAVPSAAILPVLFIRINKTIALTLYVLFFATAAVYLLLQ